MNRLFVKVQDNDLGLCLFLGLGLTASYWTFVVNAQYIYMHIGLNAQKNSCCHKAWKNAVSTLQRH